MKRWSSKPHDCASFVWLRKPRTEKLPRLQFRRALWPSLVADEPDEASKASAAPGNALGRACVSSASPGTPPKGRPYSQEGHSRTAKATLTNHHAFLKSV